MEYSRLLYRYDIINIRPERSGLLFLKLLNIAPFLCFVAWVDPPAFSFPRARGARTPARQPTALRVPRASRGRSWARPAHRPPARGVERGSGARGSTSEDERKRRPIGTDIARAPPARLFSSLWFFSRPVAACRPCLASSLRSPLRAERGICARGATGDARATRTARVRCGWFFTAAVEQGRSRAACSSPPPPCFFSRPVRRSASAAPSLHPRTRAPTRGGAHHERTCGRTPSATRRARRRASSLREVAVLCCRSSRSARRVCSWTCCSAALCLAQAPQRAPLTTPPLAPPLASLLT